jgi:hypothetical protein
MYKCALTGPFAGVYDATDVTDPPTRPDEKPPRKATGGRRRPNATPEQLAARERDADARQRTAERKRRTRELIQVGGVLCAWGIDSPEQAEELMRRLTSAEHKGWRRYLLGTLKARRTDRWPER